jgi:hypothetical protein
MSAPGRKPRPTADLARDLQGSLESAIRGLERLLQSVEQSGLAEGVRAYRMLQVVLIQQRQWASTHQQGQLLPLFRSIGETSARLHRTFAAFAEITGTLAGIEHIAPAVDVRPEPAAQAAQAAVEPDAAAVSPEEPAGT